MEGVYMKGYTTVTEDLMNTRSKDLSDILSNGVKGAFNRATLQNVKIVTKNGVTFPLVNDNDMDAIMRIWDNIKVQMVYGLYKKLPVYRDISKSALFIPNGMNVEEVITSRTLTAIRKIRKREGNKKYVFRCELDDIHSHTETEIIPVDGENEKPKEYFIVHRQVSDFVLLYSIYTLYVDLNKNKIFPVKNGVFYIGNDNLAINALDSGDSPIVIGELDQHLLTRIGGAIINDADNYDTSEFVTPHYLNNELKSIFSIYSTMTKHASVHSINIEKNAVTTDDDITNDMIEYLVSNSINKEILYPTTNRSDWPIIRFTDKEWKSVFKYIEKEYYSQHKVYSIKEKLLDPRYGFNYRLPIDDFEINISYTITEDRNIIFFLSEVLNDHVTAFMEYMVTNTNGKGFIPFTISSLLFDRPEEMKTKDLSFYDKSFLLNNPADFIMSKVYAEFIAMMVTMKDKPERNKVVSCQSPRKPNPGVAHTIQTNPTTGQSVYITKRILSPAASAKDYVIQMHRDHPNRDAVYTIEEWDRREHLRHLKSGKVVFVRASHCVRKAGEVQPADEIRLKL